MKLDAQRQVRMRALDGVVAVNLALVIAHQADAAYWHDPLNGAAFVILLFCFMRVIAERRIWTIDEPPRR